MLEKIKKRLIKILIKKRVIDTFEIEGIPHKIVDCKGPLLRIKKHRNLYFIGDGKVYSHSAIYLNPKYRVQPIFPMPQKILELWADSNELRSALVLGCGGCSIPRFLALSYPDIKITGVELSSKIIEIAHKYFLLDQIEKQFTLIEADAIEFVKNKTVKQQDVIYVDLFFRSHVISEIFSSEFLNAVYEIAAENSLVFMNVLGEGVASVKEFCDNTDIPFNTKHLVQKGNSLFLCLIKSVGGKTEKFENDLMNCEDFKVIF